MRARPVALAIGSVALVASAFLLTGSRPRVEPFDPVTVVSLPGGAQIRVVPPQLPRPSRFGDAQPCLIDTVSCLELAPEPFAPCLLAVERCSGEWRLHPLVGRTAD